jgi:hypothetical protein
MTDLIKNQPIETIIKIRDTVLEKVKQIKQIEKEIELLANSVNVKYLNIEDLPRTVRSFYDNKNDLDYSETIKLIDKRFWLSILAQIKISSAMSENAKKQLYEQLDSKPPAFNRQEIDNILNNLKAIYGNNAQQTIREVYSHLIGCYYRSADYNIKKHDNLKGVKKQFRICGNISYSNWGTLSGRWDLRTYTNYFNFEDFYTVCKILDGLPQSDYSNTFEAIAKEQLKSTDEIKTKYFDVKLYKNGNQRITWTPYGEKIRTLLNKYGSNNSLPDTLGKRYKSEHFKK